MMSERTAMMSDCLSVSAFAASSLHTGVVLRSCDLVDTCPALFRPSCCSVQFHFMQEQCRPDVGKPLEPDSMGSVRSAETGQMALQPPAFNKGDR